MIRINQTPINRCPYMEYFTNGYWCKYFGKSCDLDCRKTINLTIEEVSDNNLNNK